MLKVVLLAIPHRYIYGASFIAIQKTQNKAIAQTPSPVPFRCHWARGVFLRHTPHLTSDYFHGTAPELN